jgi:sulfoxide reductase heme-binding subunit YedZ
MNAHAMWYLTRGTGLVAMVLVTLSVLAGIAASLRAGGTRMPRFVVSGLHRNLSLLTVAFIVVHVVTTVLDAYAPITYLDAVLPFASPYRPIWLGLGALAFDIILALVITSMVRVRIGLKTWRFIHWFAYACFPITVVHALGTGSDATQRWMLGVVAACVATVVVGALWRLWTLAPAPSALASTRQAPLFSRFRASHPLVRIAGTAAVIALPVWTALWAASGPLAPHWTQRSGTPQPSRATPNPLAAYAAQQLRLDALRARQIRATKLEIAHRSAQVKATIAAIKAASAPIVVAATSSGGGSSGGYSGGYSSGGGGAVSSGGGGAVSSGGGGGGGGGGSAPSAPVAVAPPSAPAAPVAATGGS